MSAALLASLPVCAAIGVAETALSAGRQVTAAELLYGAWIHSLFAVGVALVASLLRKQAHSAAATALGLVILGEGVAVGGYWTNVLLGVPPLATAKGRLLTALLAGAWALAGLAAAYLLSRRLARVIQPMAASSAGGVAMFTLAAVVLAGALIWTIGRLPTGRGVSGKAGKPPAEAPDLIVILIDTLRRDHVSFYGYDRPTTPNIDSLFACSFAFSQGYTASTWTIPTVASVFTGLYPSSHGVNSALIGLPPEVTTLAEHMRLHGYHTAAFVANATITRSNGFGQGFDVFFPPSPPWWTYHQRTAFERAAGQVVRPSSGSQGWRITLEALRWFEHTPPPRFAYIHYLEPHSPYTPLRKDREAVAPGAPEGPSVPPLLRKYRPKLDRIGCKDWECLDDPPRVEGNALEGMIANYDGEIHLVDRRVGKLLRGLREQGITERAHIVFLSDHGEEFFDHRGWFHGNSIYEEMTGCVMAYTPPGGIRPGRRLDRPVSMLDLLRTVFEMLPIEPPPLHQGQVIPELLGSQGIARPVLSEQPPFLFSLRMGKWKLIRRGKLEDPTWLLFNMQEDPLEKHDLSAAQPDTTAWLRGYLEGIVSELEQTRAGTEAVMDDPALLERLRSLGYVD